MARILVVDDESETRDLLVETLAAAGHEAVGAESGRAAMDPLSRREFDLVLTDLVMPGMNGLELLRWIKESELEPEVIVLTAHAEVPTAVEAMRLGAYHYLAKPWNDAELREVVAKAADKKALRMENVHLKGVLTHRDPPAVMVGESPPIRELMGVVERVAQSGSAVLVLGESGTGKELVARSLHLGSPRAARPFISVNCGAMPAPLLESELFGHVKGAFTGAVATKVGLMEAADGGTLFLDEIGEMSPAMQVRLLRALDSGEVRRVGAERAFHVDVRVVAATARDLERDASEGRFRSDLYYRISAVVLRLPPLRERRSDIPLLIQHFAGRPRRGGRPLAFSPAALDLLARYAWPGNIRQLQNVIERLHILNDGDDIRPEDLPPEIRAEATPAPADPSRLSLEEVERLHVARVLEATGWNKSQAARVLEIDIKTLNKKIRDYRISRDPT
ncbi:MAG: sigma-54-dependent Fis family transcriptional regulator [Candidatus Rokubacteria bacterium]|nr:sigma-54-dependent Fis family transcriptional regulator [Candidatus Rokubacteria bacterium]